MNRYTLIVLSVLVCGLIELGLCREGNFIPMRPGGVYDYGGNQNSAEIEGLARFAVQEHNKKENALLEFARVLKAKEQVVAGKLYYLTLEVIDAGKKKIYDAKIWVKPWINFKQLQEFKHAEHGPFSTLSDLNVKRGCHGQEWLAVSTNDLEVKNAANHAVKSMQRKSNSLFLYELLEILQAKAKVVEDYAKFELHLKLRRGSEEEKHWVEIIKNSEGKFYLK